MSNRVIFLVDGFNLYHSIRQAEMARKSLPLRWLDVHGLLKSFLHTVGQQASLEDVYFFTALPFHRHRYDRGVVSRHEKHLQALRTSGVRLHVAGFKRKDLTCPHCRMRIERHEEKETDVALGVKAIELLHLGACDTLVIVSGDTDFAPALRTAKRLFPAVQICVAFPHARFNAELQQIADRSFRIRGARYAEHQFPDSVELPDGRRVRRPSGW